MFRQQALPSSASAKEYIEVRPFPKEAYEEYNMFQIDAILNTWLNNEETAQKLAVVDTLERTTLYNVTNRARILQMKDTQEKIALFETLVVDSRRSLAESRRQPSTLNDALLLYKKSNIPCKKIIIPIAEKLRRHFRLLVISPEEKKITYYDSKSNLVRIGADAFLSGLHSGKELYLALTKNKIKNNHEAINEYVRVNSDELEYDFIEEGEDNYKSSWNIHRALVLFSDIYFHVMNTCSLQFPNLEFSHYAMGHQELLNFKDCGPYVTDYARKIILGVPLSPDMPIYSACARMDQYCLFKNVDAIQVTEDKYFPEPTHTQAEFAVGVLPLADSLQKLVGDREQQVQELTAWMDGHREMLEIRENFLDFLGVIGKHALLKEKVVADRLREIHGGVSGREKSASSSSAPLSSRGALFATRDLVSSPRSLVAENAPRDDNGVAAPRGDNGVAAPRGDNGVAAPRGDNGVAAPRGDKRTALT